jgi:hypothetical protein
MFDEAILVMDARSSGESVRSSDYGRIRHGSDWTRLYKAQDFYLDLSLQRNQSEAVLLGQLIPVKEGSQIVGSVATENRRYIPLNDRGGFRVSLEPGLHDLHIHLGSNLIVVRGVEA